MKGTSAAICAAMAFLGFQLLVAAPAPPADTSAGTAVEVTFEVSGAGDTPSSALPLVKVYGSAHNFSRPAQPNVSFNGSSAEVTRLALAPGKWALSGDSPGFWVAPVQLEVGAESVKLALRLRPAGAIAGAFPDPRPELPTPERMQVFFRSSPKTAPAAKVPESVSPCILTERAFRCVLPAGVLDLRFEAPGTIPAFQWDVAVVAGEEARLGTFPVRTGSAVQGWVKTVDGSDLTEQAEARLRPRSRSGLRQSDGERLGGVQERRTSVHSRGFFQFDGVAPGEYVLEVRQPPFAVTTTTVQVLPGQVTEVVDPPLWLELPKRLEVVASPAVAPDGTPWLGALRRFDTGTLVTETVVDARPFGAEGQWSADQLAPGHYLFDLSHEGNRWHLEELELGGPETQIFLDLEVVEVEGEVFLGKEPLTATLMFGGRHGAERIQVDSNDKGRFETFLPRAGEWKVAVEAELPAIQRELPAVAIERTEDGSPTELVLRFPNTLVAGKVVDEASQPVPRALISVRGPLTDSRREKTQVRAEENGRFLVEGLPEGTAELSAIGPDDLSSDLVSVQLSEDRPLEDVVLTLRRQKRIAGVIGSDTGPVPGARIKAVPVGVPVGGVATVASGADGRFEVSVPAATRELLLTVGPPGFGLRMLRSPLPADGSPLVLRADPAAGQLRLEAKEPLFGEAGKPLVVVFHGGAHEGLPYLLAWAAGATGPRHDLGPEIAIIPGLEPGDYQACWVELNEMLGLIAGVPPRGPCVGGTLVAGGELSLDLENRPARR